MLRRRAALGALLGAWCSPGYGQTGLVVVRPAEIQDVLVNPGMGIVTFQRFNGQALNSGLTWSESGPLPSVPSDGGEAAPDSPRAAIAYCRWFWRAMEPEDGEIRWDIIDHALREAQRHGQTLSIRIMPYDAAHPVPEWYRRLAEPDGPQGRAEAVWHPDFADPLYRAHWRRLIGALGARYDGHEDLDTVDVSTIGYWGEGWSDGMPAVPIQEELIDIYLSAFKQTRLLVNFDERHALAYGVRHGTGWRLDCLGDMGTTGRADSFSHMLDVYPQQIARLGLAEAWRLRPVSLESCGVPASWRLKGWDIDYILDQALRWHVTSLNIKSSVIPPEWRDRFDFLQRRMGYRFVLRRFAYPSSARIGQALRVTSWWFNAGVAPVYRRYDLALQLQGADRSHVLALPADVTTWLPGDAVCDAELPLPATVSPGAYELRIALLDPRTGRPAIQLANTGREADGWYGLGKLTLSP